MSMRDLPDMYALVPWAYISGKSRMPMLQVLCITLFPPVVLIPQVIVTLVHKVISTNC